MTKFKVFFSEGTNVDAVVNEFIKTHNIKIIDFKFQIIATNLQDYSYICLEYEIKDTN